MKVEASKETCVLAESKALNPTKLDEPFVSIVIPTKNEESFLPYLLSSIKGQEGFGSGKIKVFIGCRSLGAGSFKTKNAEF